MVKSCIHVLRFSFQHSEQPYLHNNTSIKSVSKATDTCASSYYFNSKSLPTKCLGAKSCITAFRSSFAHSEQPNWQHKKSIKSGSRATNTCASSCYFNSKSLPTCRLCTGRNDAGVAFVVQSINLVT
jgi:hypothetical protein